MRVCVCACVCMRAFTYVLVYACLNARICCVVEWHRDTHIQSSQFNWLLTACPVCNCCQSPWPPHSLFRSRLSSVQSLSCLRSPHRFAPGPCKLQHLKLIRQRKRLFSTRVLFCWSYVRAFRRFLYCVRHCFLVAFVLGKARAFSVEWANRSYNAAED